MFTARLGNAPTVGEVASVRKIWEVALTDVPDTALAAAVLEYIRTGEFWPSPGAIRRLIPNDRALTDRTAWRAIAEARPVSRLSPAHQRAAAIAGVKDQWGMRRMESADLEKLERRFMSACATPEVRALSAEPPRAITAQADEPQRTPTPIPTSTPTAKPPARNPHTITEAECLEKRPQIAQYRGTLAWASILRTTQVMIAEGRQ